MTAFLALERDMCAGLILVPDPHGANKTQPITDNEIAVLIENDKDNIKAAAKTGRLSLLLWNCRIG
jgi:hypothetical protein